MVKNLIGASMSPSTIVMLVLLAVMVIVLIVLPMFTNRRRNKAINDLHSSLRPGDIIKTVGGIVGTIIEIKEVGPLDKEMVIETGVGEHKSTMVFDIQAVYQVVSKTNAPEETPAPAAEKPAPAEEKAEAVEQEVRAEEAVAEKAETVESTETAAPEAQEASAEAEAKEEKAEAKPAAAHRKNAKK